jgi:hypothetical protein
MACGLVGRRARNGWKGVVLLEVAVPSLLNTTVDENEEARWV